MTSLVQLRGEKGEETVSEAQVPLQRRCDPVFLDTLDPVSLLEQDSTAGETDATLCLSLG